MILFRRLCFIISVIVIAVVIIVVVVVVVVVITAAALAENKVDRRGGWGEGHGGGRR